jgi:hypothetical protein
LKKTKNNSKSGSAAKNSLRLPIFPQIAYLFGGNENTLKLQRLKN